MRRDDFSDVERRWRTRCLFGPPKRRPKIGLWVLMAGLLASGMYIAAQTVLPTRHAPTVAPAAPETPPPVNSTAQAARPNR